MEYYSSLKLGTEYFLSFFLVSSGVNPAINLQDNTDGGSLERTEAAASDESEEDAWTHITHISGSCDQPRPGQSRPPRRGVR